MPPVQNSSSQETILRLDSKTLDLYPVAPRMHTTPPSLLEQLRHSADQKAWERFVKLYGPLLYYWARRLGL